MAPERDVLIIGAGVSGMVAAHRLRQAWPEVKLTVLEANDRVGGRTQSITIKNAKGEDDTFDLGGHWIASTQPDIMDLVKELDMEYYPQNIKGRKIMQVGDNVVRTYKSDIPDLNSWMALIQMQRFIDRVEALAKRVNVKDPWNSCPYAEEFDGLTVDAFARRHLTYESVRQVFNSAMQATMGCDLTQISVLYFLAYANSSGGIMKLLLAEKGAAQEFRVKGGNQQITLKLAEKVGKGDIMLQKPVTKIEEIEDGVKVTCRDGSTFEAKQVICTTPANQTYKIEFNPPLPTAKRSLLKTSHMGNLMKFFLIYEEAFWLEAGFSGEVVSTGGPTDDPDCDFGPATIYYDATTMNGTPALIAFSAGRNADQWFSKTQEERKKALIKQTVDYFGPKAANVFMFLEKDWTQEEFIGGAPVTLGITGSTSNLALLRQSHGERIHFAGTETATQWNGYLSGAVQSGKKAAAQVIKQLQPEKLEREHKDVLAEFKTLSAKHPKNSDYHSSSWCTIL